MAIHPKHISDYVEHSVSLKFNSPRRVSCKETRQMRHNNYIDMSRHIPIVTSKWGDTGVSFDDENSVINLLTKIYTLLYDKGCVMYLIITPDFQIGIECSDKMYEEIAPCLI